MSGASRVGVSSRPNPQCKISGKAQERGKALTQYRADANENQVGYGDHDGQLDNQHRDAEQDLDDSQGYARCG